MRKMYVCIVVMACAIALLAANSKTTSKFGSGLLTRPMGFEETKVELYTKHNATVDDLDTAFAHLTGVTSDSLYKTAVKATRGYFSSIDSVYTSKGVVGNSITVGSGGRITTLTITDATEDTLTITIGAKTWKFVPVANQ